jgi:hypothetical protein
MSFFTSPDADKPIPQIHALVIGVNEYPHLLNGTLLPAAATMGLGQLTSPVVSAQAFADWLRDSYTNAAGPANATPTVPLGSIDLLLSPAGSQYPVTMAVIENAFDDWEARCNRSPDNIAIFYFCGHGIEAEVLVLLAQNFGENPNRLWENGIDFDGTLFGMGECVAKTQCYFIDACRETPIEALKQRGRVAAKPLKTSKTLKQGNRDACVILATPLAQKAHAPPAAGSVSYYTTALIDCLTNHAARGRSGAQWAVNTDSLKTAMKVRMLRTKLADGTRLACDISKGTSNLPPADLHEWPGPPMALTDVTCSPSNALEYAFIHVNGGPVAVPLRPPGPDVWELVLDAADGHRYDVSARFDPGGPYRYADSVVGMPIQPPYHTIRLRAH